MEDIIHTQTLLQFSAVREFAVTLITLIKLNTLSGQHNKQVGETAQHLLLLRGMEALMGECGDGGAIRLATSTLSDTTYSPGTRNTANSS